MASSDPRVTVGVPVYNGERYLAQCLDALLAQTYPHLVVIVCDNASSDRTPEIALAYARCDARVTYHRNPENIGCPRNFTRVFSMAQTPYFRWAAADDLSAPTALARCVDVLERHPEVVQAYPRTILIDADGQRLRIHDDALHVVDERPSDRYMAVTRRLGMCNAIYGVIRTDVLRRTAVLKNYIGSDVPLQAELSLHGHIWEVPEPLFLRRMHPAAQSAMSAEARTTHYDPTARGERGPSLWRHLAERIAGVARAPIGARERARILAFLLREALKSRDGFALELAAALRLGLPRSGRPAMAGAAPPGSTP